MSQREPIDMVPYYNFWADGCAAMFKHCMCILYHSGLVESAKDVALFIEGVPRSSKDLDCEKWKARFFYKCCTRAFDNAKGEARTRVEASVAWFFGQFVNRTTVAKEMLLDTMTGILVGVTEAKEWLDFQERFNERG